MRPLVVFIVGLVVLTPLSAGAVERTVGAAAFSEAPRIDGILDDSVWSSASPTTGFVQIEPQFGEPSPFRTEVLVGYTEEALFVAFRCFDPEPDQLSAAITSRDGELRDDDSVTLLLDTFDDGRRAYFFATNTLGVQQDGKVADNGRVVDLKWDASWFSAASKTEEGWTAEFAIPFEILKFRGGENTTWGINAHRSVPRRLETSMWSGPAESKWRVSAFGTLTGLEFGVRRGKRYDLIPYAIVALEEGGDTEVEVGLDFRYRITNDLGLDLTINPDFALVEADVEQINLSRFELFVPEKRPFFLEGVEMFSQRIRQFYSRRIGDISWGGKLNGTMAGWDVAALATRADLETEIGPGGEIELEDADYSVLRLQRGIFGSSTVGFLAANRNTDEGNTGSVGIDATLFFTEKLGMTAQVLRAHGTENDGALAWFVRPAFDSANTHFHVRYTNLDTGLKDNINAIGFLRDDNRKEVDSYLGHTFWFKDSVTEKLRVGANYNRYWSQEGDLRAWEIFGEAELVFTNFWEIRMSYVDALEIFEKEFRNTILKTEVGYDNRSGKRFKLSAGVGENYDSDLRLFGLGTDLSLSEAWNLSYEVTWLELDPDPKNRSTWIHVLSSSYHFTNDLYLKIFVQTNSVISKENVQLLGVWRIFPPFGSLQLAFQRGTSEIGESSEQGNSFFTKLSWVF